MKYFFNKRFLLATTLFLIITNLSACETVSVRPRDELTLDETLHEMILSYENKEVSRFLQFVSRYFEGGYPTFEEDVRKDLKRHSDIRIEYKVLEQSAKRNILLLHIEWTKNVIIDRDIDRDGMEDDWETRYGFDPDNPSDAFEDSDGDGVINRDEYKGGSDPLASASGPTGTVNPSIPDEKRQWSGKSILIFEAGGRFLLAGVDGDKLFGEIDNTGRD